MPQQSKHGGAHRKRVRYDGNYVDHLPEILKVVRDFGLFEYEMDRMRRTNGWGEMEWFLPPDAMLDGASPAEALVTDLPLIHFAARIEFAGDV